MAVPHDRDNRDEHAIDAALTTLGERGIDFDRLLRQHSYTPEQLSKLLDIGEHTIRRAAREGRLHATMVEHEIVSISRSDALVWLQKRD